jgi:hypothetical protein
MYTYCLSTVSVAEAEQGKEGSEVTGMHCVEALCKGLAELRERVQGWLEREDNGLVMLRQGSCYGYPGYQLA